MEKAPTDLQWLLPILIFAGLISRFSFSAKNAKIRSPEKKRALQYTASTCNTKYSTDLKQTTETWSWFAKILVLKWLLVNFLKSPNHTLVKIYDNSNTFAKTLILRWLPAASLPDEKTGRNSIIVTEDPTHFSTLSTDSALHSLSAIRDFSLNILLHYSWPGQRCHIVPTWDLIELDKNWDTLIFKMSLPGVQICPIWCQSGPIFV